jgi:hypothetical protein
LVVLGLTTGLTPFQLLNELGKELNAVFFCFRGVECRSTKEAGSDVGPLCGGLDGWVGFFEHVFEITVKTTKPALVSFLFFT